MTDVRYEVDGHVGVITIARPEVHNALRRQTYDELEELVRGTTARCLVMTDEGRSFCWGDDVRELMGGGDPETRAISMPRPRCRASPRAPGWRSGTPR